MTTLVTLIVLLVMGGVGFWWAATRDLYKTVAPAGTTVTVEPTGLPQRTLLFLGLGLLILAVFFAGIGFLPYSLIHTIKTMRVGTGPNFPQENITVHDPIDEVRLEGDTLRFKLPKYHWAQWITVTLVKPDGNMSSWAFPGDAEEWSSVHIKNAVKIRVHYGDHSGPSEATEIDGPAKPVASTATLPTPASPVVK